MTAAFQPAAHWRAPLVVPAPGEALLVAASLDVAPDVLDALRASFSPRETARFASFAHDEHRRRWGASRGMLRDVLGALTGRAPRDVALVSGAHGKPRLADSALRFNLSHSHGAALLAVAHVEVGVDIELPRARRTDDLARRFYAEGEQRQVFAHADPAARAEVFFRLWTCKEAFLKCTGEGLSRSLRSYEVQLSPPRLEWARGVEARDFSVYPQEPGGAYRAALVAQAAALRVHHARWPARDQRESG